jgi:Ca2+-binding RTX toxin-like protein
MPIASSLPVERYVSRLHAQPAPEDHAGPPAELGNAGPVFAVFPGTPGDDNLSGTNDDDTITGLGGSDTLIGRGGDDLLDAGDQDDYLRGDPGNDRLFGGDGDDYLRGGAGDDTVDGGAGLNRAAFFDSTVGVQVSLLLQGAAQNTGQGMDLLTKIQHLSGTRFDDLLIGDSGDNWLWGDISAADPATGGGNDTLIGNDGNDLLDAGTGDQVFLGQRGNDSVTVFGNQTDTLGGVRLDLNIQSGFAQDTGQGMMHLKGIENLSGSVHDDDFIGNRQGNILAGRDGDDSLSGGSGADSLYGDGAILVESPRGTSGAIVFLTQVVLEEGSPAGRDVLSGDAGSDVLIGGLGADTLTGGAGRDIFAYRVVEDSAPRSGDYVTDFSRRDQVNLKDIDADVSTTTNEAFHFVAGFTGAAAEAWLHYDRELDLTYLELDVNGDATADAIIKFAGRVTTAFDFEL